MSRYLVIGLDTERPFLHVVNVPDDTHQARHRALDTKYDRDDLETGEPLPAGVDGYHLGRRHR